MITAMCLWFNCLKPLPGEVTGQLLFCQSPQRGLETAAFGWGSRPGIGEPGWRWGPRRGSVAQVGLGVQAGSGGGTRWDYGGLVVAWGAMVGLEVQAGPRVYVGDPGGTGGLGRGSGAHVGLRVQVGGRGPRWDWRVQEGSGMDGQGLVWEESNSVEFRSPGTGCPCCISSAPHPPCPQMWF